VVREARRLHFILALCIPLYAYAAETIPQHPVHAVKALESGMWTAVLVDLGILAVVRWKIMRPSMETLRLRPDDARAVARWRVGSLNASLISESIPIYGATLKFLGGTFHEALPFYALGLVLMLVFVPRSP
jgi:hypothetical protein